jgi:hypothetical protein
MNGSHELPAPVSALARLAKILFGYKSWAALNGSELFGFALQIMPKLLDSGFSAFDRCIGSPVRFGIAADGRSWRTSHGA